MRTYCAAVGIVVLLCCALPGDVPSEHTTRLIEHFKSGQTYYVKDSDAERWVLVLLDTRGRATLKSTLSDDQIAEGSYAVANVGVDWVELTRTKNRNRTELPIGSIARVVRWSE